MFITIYDYDEVMSVTMPMCSYTACEYPNTRHRIGSGLNRGQLQTVTVAISYNFLG